MGWIDQVPGCGKLYIGGIYALRHREAFKEAGVTHVVSVLRWPIEDELVKPYTRLQIEVDDDEDENLLESFPACVKFIKDALEAGGGVFVHCAMGKSRSATIVIAYMMSTFHMTPTQALTQLRESRGVCEPNPGFMKQLELYYEMSTPIEVESNPSYQRWLYQRELDAARAAKIAPDADKIRFGDEHVGEGTKGETAEAAQMDAAQPGGPTQMFEMKCRKCRRTLANSSYLIAHEPPAQNPHNIRSAPVPPSACAHLFLEPLSWMRSQLEQGQLEGRLECPNAKCGANVGKYAWQGMQCSCGEWVVPGISLIKARIDEHKIRGGGKAGGGDDMGIRRPPGLRGVGGGGGQGGNL